MTNWTATQTRRLAAVGRILLVGTRLMTGLAAWAVGFLAANADPSPADDELSSSIRGGILNYRTGKFDDGTDPGGLYERD